MIFCNPKQEEGNGRVCVSSVRHNGTGIRVYIIPRWRVRGEFFLVPLDGRVGGG